MDNFFFFLSFCLRRQIFFPFLAILKFIFSYFYFVLNLFFFCVGFDSFFVLIFVFVSFFFLSFLFQAYLDMIILGIRNMQPYSYLPMELPYCVFEVSERGRRKYLHVELCCSWYITTYGYISAEWKFTRFRYCFVDSKLSCGQLFILLQGITENLFFALLYCMLLCWPTGCCSMGTCST